MSAHQLPTFGLLGAFAMTAAVAWAGAGRRRGTPTITGTVLVLQGALHLLFSTAGSHPAAHAASGAADTAHRHTMTGAATGHATTSNAAMASMDTADAMNATSSTALDSAVMGSGTGMLAVHLVAALLCGLWLAHGEAAFFTLAEAALAYAFTPLRLLLARVRVPDAPRGPVRRARRNAHRLHTVVLAHTLSRRGPPRLSVPRATALGAHV
ncbi:hypothetical protein OG361_11485 [Streptomyces sp. NBC_00090]|uniref:hypothetical protein n=1 Tax=Streptomyces sp. NBC_00090 TaxID=2903619 RepID=UPI00324641F4